jgi:hypothetical protein
MVPSESSSEPLRVSLDASVAVDSGAANTVALSERRVIRAALLAVLVIVLDVE